MQLFMYYNLFHVYTYVLSLMHMQLVSIYSFALTLMLS